MRTLLALILTMTAQAHAGDWVNAKYRYTLWCTSSTAKMTAALKNETNYLKYRVEATKECETTAGAIPQAKWAALPNPSFLGCSEAIQNKAPKSVSKEKIQETVRAACGDAIADDNRHATGNTLDQINRIANTK